MRRRPEKSLLHGADVGIRIGSSADIDMLADIDRDAGALFESAGLQLDTQNERELTLAERKRWLACLAAGPVMIAVDRAGEGVGFAAVATRDDEPYLDQLSVRLRSMGQRIGTALLSAAVTVARQGGGQALWLTTYSHLSWNRPYYERHGFVLVSPEQCGEELRDELALERRLLPKPEERVVMRKALAGE